MDDDGDDGDDDDDDDEGDDDDDAHWMQDLPRLAVGALSKGPGGKIHS